MSTLEFSSRGFAAVVSFYAIIHVPLDEQPAIFRNIYRLFISWNCVGWQSLILLGLSLMVGLRGPMTLATRIEVIALGVLGTLLVNIARITVVCALAALVGYLPAILFHDYGGTLLLVAWLFTFWLIAYRWLVPDLELAGNTNRPIKT